MRNHPSVLRLGTIGSRTPGSGRRGGPDDPTVKCERDRATTSSLTSAHSTGVAPASGARTGSGAAERGDPSDAADSLSEPHPSVHRSAPGDERRHRSNMSSIFNPISHTIYLSTDVERIRSGGGRSPNARVRAGSERSTRSISARDIYRSRMGPLPAVAAAFGAVPWLRWTAGTRVTGGTRPLVGPPSYLRASSTRGHREPNGDRDDSGREDGHLGGAGGSGRAVVGGERRCRR